MKKVIIYYNFVKINITFEIVLTQKPNPLMKHHFKKLHGTFDLHKTLKQLLINPKNI